MSERGCYRLRGVVKPLTPSDAAKLAEVYEALRKSLNNPMIICYTAEAGGAIVSSCSSSVGTRVRFLVAFWIEPPTLTHGGVEAVIGFSVESDSADGAVEGFKLLADALARAAPARFTVKLS